MGSLPETRVRGFPGSRTPPFLMDFLAFLPWAGSFLALDGLLFQRAVRTLQWLQTWDGKLLGTAGRASSEGRVRFLNLAKVPWTPLHGPSQAPAPSGTVPSLQWRWLSWQLLETPSVPTHLPPHPPRYQLRSKMAFTHEQGPGREVAHSRRCLRSKVRSPEST